MEVFKSKSEMYNFSLYYKKSGRTIGLVPTMGFLHEGHLSLIRKSKEECDITVISIFVNPVQFGPNEDFQRYPRNFAKDKELARKEGVDVIFYPEVAEMYPQDYLTYVNVKKLDKMMCGKFRPGHFRGVCTVVLKLFNIICPDKSYFGMKDYQQFIILKKMVKDLDLNIEIIGCDTIRENDGLALSSRNSYLSSAERKEANILYKTILFAEKELKEKKRSIMAIRRKSIEMLYGCKFISKVEYFDIRDAENLKALKKIEYNKEGDAENKILIALAAWIGKTRLIDNKVVVL